MFKKVIVNSTYFKCDSSCLDNEIIDRDFNLFWKDKEKMFEPQMIRELVISETRNCSHIHQTWSRYIWSESGRFRAVRRRLFELCLRCLSWYPFVQDQTVMNAASGIIHDLTVKSFRSWTMRVRKNNRKERIPLYTRHLSNGSGMAVPFPPSQRQDWKDLPVV